MAQAPQRIRRRERKNITAGVAHVNAQLQQYDDHHHRRPGQCDCLVIGRHDGLQGQPQVDALRRPGRRRRRRPQGRRAWRPHPRGRGQGSGFGPRERASRAAGGRFPDHLDPRRDPDPAQRRAARRSAAASDTDSAARRLSTAGNNVFTGGRTPRQGQGRNNGRQREELAGTQEAQRAGAQARHRRSRRKRGRSSPSRWSAASA